MTPVTTELDATIRLAIAGLVGLGVGLEREWSGHARGPSARFAGLRTFLLLGIVGGAAGLLMSVGFSGAASVALAGGMALAVVAYAATVRRANTEIDGTTEAAALAVAVLGALAGIGWLALAAGAGAVVVLALSEKTRLHWLVGRLAERELRAALQFAVLALVVLPLLPTGPFGGPLALRPRALWTITLFFCALNFAGFLARRAVGPSAGYTITGILGGLISSTGVTLDFSRTSRREPSFGAPLAYGVIGACTVLIPRVLVVSAVLNLQVARRLVEIVWPVAVCGAVLVVAAWRRDRHAARPAPSTERVESPLRLAAALQMAAAFQVSLTILDIVNRQWGAPALYPTAVALGLTNMDALTMSMSRLDASVPAAVAAQAIAVGIMANTILKLGLAVGVGSGAFRRVVARGLGAMAVASGAGLAFVSWY